MNKKTLIIVASVVIILVILLGIYFLFLKKPVATEPVALNNNPFGTPGNQDVSVRQTNDYFVGGNESSSATQIKDESDLKLVSEAPVAGANFYTDPDASSTKLYFVERATGHVFTANITSGMVERVTNTTIPKIDHVVWGPNSQSFISNRLETGVIKTAANTIVVADASSTSGLPMNTESADLPDEILGSTISPNGKQIFYYAGGFNGAEGYITDFSVNNSSLAWKFPTSEWVVNWPVDNQIFFNSKPSNSVPGFLYSLNLKNKSFDVVLSGIPGLTTNISPKGDSVLYTTISGKTWQSSIDFLKDNLNIPVPEVLPEKCAWSLDESMLYCAREVTKSDNAPDDWYQGTVSYDDELWSFNLSTGETRRLSSLNPSTGYNIDLINPHISKDGNYLLFMNKKDLSLWTIKLPENSQPVTGD